MPEDFVVELAAKIDDPPAGQVGEIGRPVIGRQNKGPSPLRHPTAGGRSSG